MFRKTSLRKMLRETREVAKLLNELESVSRRLRNRIQTLSEMERFKVQLEKMFDSAGGVLYSQQGLALKALMRL